MNPEDFAKFIKSVGEESEKLKGDPKNKLKRLLSMKMAAETTVIAEPIHKLFHKYYHSDVPGSKDLAIHSLSVILSSVLIFECDTIDEALNILKVVMQKTKDEIIRVDNTINKD